MSEKANVNSAPSSISDEIAALRSNFPSVSIASATDDFITASYQRTPYTRIKVTLTFPEGYPTHPLIVLVASDKCVPAGLKKKLERELGKTASDLAGQYNQVNDVFQRLITFVDTNRFVPCWRELKQCVDLVNNNDNKGSSSTIKINEIKGKINLRLQGGKYFYSCSIIIDEAYPSTKTHVDYGKACHLKMESTNFPPKIETMLTTQAQELVRRMQDGMTAEDALKMSNPIRAPKGYLGEDSKEPTKVRLTQETLKGLKKDTETLKDVRDLREVNAATTQGNAHVKAHHAKERKDARRAIKKITASEIAKDLSAEEKEKKWQLEEKARIAGYNISEYDGSNPQPSLLSLVIFLMEKIQRLPEETCPVCSQHVLPSDPQALNLLYTSSSSLKTEKEKKMRKAAKLKRPVRTFCTHWYHYDCLDIFMTEPPFGAECMAKGCGRRVYHPDWPGDIKELERAWANRQARAREIEDAAMFL